MSSTNGVGGISGLDTTALMQSMVQVAQVPIQALQTKRAGLSGLRGLFDSLAATATSLQTTADALKLSSSFASLGASSSDTTKVSAQATTGAIVGAHTLVVTDRARATTLASQGYASATASVAGTGNLLVRVGTTSTAVAITSGQDSLGGIAAAINAANLGVQASVVNDGSATPNRLVLRGASTGLAHAVSLDASGLTGGASPLTMSSLVSAQDAAFTLDGLAMTRDSNVVSDALTGVTLTLADTTGAQGVRVDVSVDTAGTVAKVQGLVNTYNAIVSAVGAQSTPGASGAKGGPLIGDYSASLGLQTLATAIASAQGPAGAKTLASIGVSTQKNGTLSLDQTKLTAALGSDTGAVGKLVADAATRLSAAALSLDKASGGVFTNRSTQLAGELRDLDKKIAQQQASVVRYQETLNRRFAALNSLSASFDKQSSFLTNTTASWFAKS